MAELIVSIAILAILSTISYVLYTGNINTSRDATRLSNIRTLYSGAKSLVANNTKIPFPDRGIALQASGVHIGYQGYVGPHQSIDMGFDSANYQDPQDQQAYTYRINKNRDKGQFLTYLENKKYSDTASILFIDNAYAAQDYSAKYPYTIGDPLGVIILSGSQAPAQEDALTANGGIVITNSGGSSSFSGAIVNILEDNTSLAIVLTEGKGNSGPILSGNLAPDIIHKLITEELIIENSNQIKRKYSTLETSNDLRLSCAIKKGDVECWGQGLYKRDGGYATKPIFTEEQVAVEVNSATACSLGISGKVRCWGYGFTTSHGSAIPAENLSNSNTNWNNMESISTGKGELCGIIKSTKKVLCTNGYTAHNNHDYEMIDIGAVSPSNALNFCGVTSSGGLYCANQYKTYQTSSHGNITSLSVGNLKYACLTNSAGKVYCWDTSTNSQLVVSPLLSHAKSVKVFDSFGNRVICIDKISGGVLCWDYENNTKRVFISDPKIKDYTFMGNACVTDGNGSICPPYISNNIFSYPKKQFESIFTTDLIEKHTGSADFWIRNPLGFVRPFNPSTQILGETTQNITANGACKQKTSTKLFDCGSGDIPNTNILVQSHAGAVGSWICGTDATQKGHCFMRQQTKMKINWPQLNNITVKDIVGGEGFGCAITSTGTTLCRDNNSNSYTGPIGTSILSTNGDKVCAVYNNNTQIKCWRHGDPNSNVENDSLPSGIESLYMARSGGLICALSKEQRVYCRGNIDRYRSAYNFSEIIELSGSHHLILGPYYTCGWTGNNIDTLRCRGDYQK